MRICHCSLATMTAFNVGINKRESQSVYIKKIGRTHAAVAAAAAA